MAKQNACPITRDIVEWLEKRYARPVYREEQLPVDIQLRAFHDGRESILEFLRAELKRQEETTIL